MPLIRGMSVDVDHCVDEVSNESLLCKLRLFVSYPIEREYYDTRQGNPLRRFILKCLQQACDR